MLNRVDRVQVAVQSADTAADTFSRLFGTEVVRKESSRYLSANKTVLAFGESEIELCEADGTGRVADFLTERGEGLLTAGFCCAKPEALKERLQALSYEVTEENGQLYLSAEEHFGLPIVISETKPLNRIGPVSFLFEVTPTLISDWRHAAAHFSGIFDLNPRRFVKLKSEVFGYDGTLTMFDPPNRLDRIEIGQVVKDDVPMARWVKRFGDSLYMCSCETHDIENLVERFIEAGVRWIPRNKNREEERDGFWTHPADLHGVLMGVSRTTVPWEFSGRPEFANPPSGPTKFQSGDSAPQYNNKSSNKK